MHTYLLRSPVVPHIIRQFLDAGIMEDNEIHTQCRLMYMYCHQHNKPRTWKNRDIPDDLSIMDTKPHTFLGKRHNTIS